MGSERHAPGLKLAFVNQAPSVGRRTETFSVDTVDVGTLQKVEVHVCMCVCGCGWVWVWMGGCACVWACACVCVHSYMCMCVCIPTFYIFFINRIRTYIPIVCMYSTYSTYVRTYFHTYYIRMYLDYQQEQQKMSPDSNGGDITNHSMVYHLSML